ncbi:HD-domain/PDEase-like protein [Obba rivulosa]|uniref:Phosphodiesterase n=1 Tax=Obba rivulosa TaxID=1052685 RepID=A0A8E2DN87_9APHY|nr:HD-domain/PDEase-like protein [Obba rivulosa]
MHTTTKPIPGAVAPYGSRRRSVDVGGLALALGEQGSGHGWGGWEDAENGETGYAEVLIDVRAHTESILNMEPVQSPAFVYMEDDTRCRLIESLCSWNFEPHKLPEEEVIACSYILFEALYRIEGMQDAVGIPLSRIATFLHHLRQIYRRGNTYHNFQHALDVFQATHHFLFCAGVVPPVSILLDADGRTWTRDKDDTLLSCLTCEDLFALYIAAVGHDVGHPGLTNSFLKNAKTPLAQVYDDKSVLEQMHYSLILQIMRHTGLGSLLDHSQPGSFRKLLLGTVLATDLGVHNEFMQNFEDLLAGKQDRQFRRRVVLCQAIIKCADISNPGRPYLVSQHWASALEAEWSSQLLLEQHLQLPASVKPSDNPLSEAQVQIWFINAFAHPLFELVARGVPEMECFAQQCCENLALWETRRDELATNADLAFTSLASRLRLPSPSQLPTDFLSAFPPTLPVSFRALDSSTPSSSSPITADRSSNGDARSPDSDPHAYTSPPSPSCSSTRSSSPSLSMYESCESSLPSPTASAFAHSRSNSRSRAAPAAAPLPPPRLEIRTVSTQRRRSPSVASSAGTSGTAATGASREAAAAIRAAYKASVRKRKSFHRTSWNPPHGANNAAQPQMHGALSPGPSPLTSESVSEGPASARSPLTPPDVLAQGQSAPLALECGSVS